MSGKPLEQLNGIFISPEARKKFGAFEAQYSHLRAQESRSMTEEEIRKLPETSPVHPQHAEWQIRKDTTERFMQYLAKKSKSLSILDAGCGNGFFSHLMAERGHKVIGVDISLFELELAAKAFGTDNPAWYYIDLETEHVPVRSLDLVTFNASLQYFSDPAAVIRKLLTVLKPAGEIHILESPIYTSAKEAERARENSFSHFQKLGSGGMMHFYHYHQWSVFEGLNYKRMSGPATALTRVFGGRKSPFPWIMIKKPRI